MQSTLPCALVLAVTLPTGTALAQTPDCQPLTAQYLEEATGMPNGLREDEQKEGAVTRAIDSLHFFARCIQTHAINDDDAACGSLLRLIYLQLVRKWVDGEVFELPPTAFGGDSGPGGAGGDALQTSAKPGSAAGFTTEAGDLDRVIIVFDNSFVDASETGLNGEPTGESTTEFTAGLADDDGNPPSWAGCQAVTDILFSMLLAHEVCHLLNDPAVDGTMPVNRDCYRGQAESNCIPFDLKFIALYENYAI